MDKIKPLFTAVATAIGGRSGHTEAQDHSVSAELSVPKAMGGPGRPNTTTPEHLFAAGYAACFGGALDYVATQHKRNAKGAAVTCSVSIGPRDGGGFGLAVSCTSPTRACPKQSSRRLPARRMKKSVPTRMRRGATWRWILR